MKKNFKKIFKDKNNLMILIISVITLIIGTLAWKFLWSFLIILTIDLLLFIPQVKVNMKNIKRKKRTKGKKDNDKNKLLKVLLSIFLSFFILGLVAVIVFFFIIVTTAPNFNPQKLYHNEASILYDKDGKIFAKVGAEIREKVTFNEMSEVLIDAIIATEDSRFFQHNGFDLPRFLKASFGQALGRDAGGASTLTMQLSKNHFTSTTATGIKGIIRKFTDIYFSIFKIEKRYTKFEIFEFYANSANFGARKFGGAYGVEQASQIYFGKKSKDLTLPEAAMIAGLLQAPNAYDPYVNPDDAEVRRKTVLYLMERHGYINKEERQLAEKVHISELLFEHEDAYSEYQGFINAVTNEVEELTELDPYTTSMEIYTTMDTKKQEHINSILSGENFKWENDVVDGGIAVIDVNTGAVVALGAGRNHQGQKVWNLATDMKRQIGSTAKPLFDYAPGIEYNNWSSYQPFIDEPHSYSTGMSIRNWDSKYEGLVTLREAVVQSRNIPALKAFQSVDNKKILSFTKSIGLSPELENGKVHEAHSLGGYNGESPLSLAAAYAPFANGGYYIKPHTFTKVKYRDNNKVFENKIKKDRVMRESTAYIMSDVLVDTVPWSMRISGITFGAKTGTSNFPTEVFKKYKLPSYAVNDLWVAGIHPDYSIAVWYGYDKLSSNYYNKFGSTEPRKLFQAVAKGVFTERKQFKKPNDVIELEIEKETYPAMLPSPFTPKNMIIKELFIKGLEPTEISPRYNQLDNPTNLKAVQEGSVVKLSWEPIKTPDSIDTNVLTTQFNKIFRDQNTRNKFLNARINYNKSTIGDIGYNVYIKNNDSLQLLGYTKNNYFEHSNNNSSATYVVKSAYSIFKDNISEGVETTIELGNTGNFINSMLIGDEIVELSINGVYAEINPPVSVLDNTDDVTHLATITKVVIDNNTNNEVDNIDTSFESSYTITYTIKYKDYIKKHIRKVVIK